jgi:biopolymer transport protein ExbB
MRSHGLFRLLLILVIGIAAGACLAQGPAAGLAAPVATPETMSFQWLWKCGGWLMYVLAAMSIGTVAFVIYFFAVLRAEQVVPPRVHRETMDRIRKGDFEDAMRACESGPSPISAVSAVALEYVRNVPDMDPAMLKDLVEGEGSRQAERIQGQIQYLLDMAVVAPMVGFLGTVVGMLFAFNAVAMDIAKAKPMVLVQGVAQAIITTVFGLLIGIPAMIFYAYFRRKSASLVSHLEAAATEVLMALVSRKPARKAGQA